MELQGRVSCLPPVMQCPLLLSFTGVGAGPKGWWKGRGRVTGAAPPALLTTSPAARSASAANNPSMLTLALPTFCHPLPRLFPILLALYLFHSLPIPLVFD